MFYLSRISVVGKSDGWERKKECFSVEPDRNRRGCWVEPLRRATTSLLVARSCRAREISPSPRVLLEFGALTRGGVPRRTQGRPIGYVIAYLPARQTNKGILARSLARARHYRLGGVGRTQPTPARLRIRGLVVEKNCLRAGWIVRRIFDDFGYPG